MPSLLMIGLGSFGYHVVRTLSNSDFFVTAIDSDVAKVEAVKTYVQEPMVGDATQLETLRELSIRDYDYVVVSLGDRLDTSILTCLHLHDLQAKNIVVKVNDVEHARVLREFHVSRVIFPEREAAEDLAHTIADLNVLHSVAVTEGFTLVELAVPSKFEGKKLSELDLPRNFGVQVVLIHQHVPEETILPRADFVLKSSDTLAIIGSDEAIRRVQNEF
ncbi:MAG TPA: TrkA family potassium uptake protein [Firmicutes bacterium]|nr:TrkA family potassium uptake protein [Bacillota bacterium]